MEKRKIFDVTSLKDIINVVDVILPAGEVEEFTFISRGGTRYRWNFDARVQEKVTNSEEPYQINPFYAKVEPSTTDLIKPEVLDLDGTAEDKKEESKDEPVADSKVAEDAPRDVDETAEYEDSDPVATVLSNLEEDTPYLKMYDDKCREFDEMVKAYENQIKAASAEADSTITALTDKNAELEATIKTYEESSNAPHCVMCKEESTTPLADSLTEQSHQTVEELVDKLKTFGCREITIKW